MANANSHTPCPCRAQAALCRGLEKSLSERHGRGMARARHGMCESHTAVLCKSNGKDPIETLNGTAWERHGMCELALKRPRRKITTHCKLSAWVQNEQSFTTILLYAVWAYAWVVHPLHFLSESSGSGRQSALSDFGRHASRYSKTGRPLCKSQTRHRFYTCELEFSMLSCI
jgi:hypothetical protein